jgi:hypothetical protein
MVVTGFSGVGHSRGILGLALPQPSRVLCGYLNTSRNRRTHFTVFQSQKTGDRATTGGCRAGVVCYQSFIPTNSRGGDDNVLVTLSLMAAG